MGVAQISGVVLLLAQRHGIPLSFYTPSEVKAAVTGSGRAEKAQIGTMVTKILGLSETPKPADAADALAIAITCGWKSYSPSGTLPTTKATETWQKAIAAAANRKRS
jgi:crossover junction endodeoxyribonuclease RuvC